MGIPTGALDFGLAVHGELVKVALVSFSPCETRARVTTKRSNSAEAARALLVVALFSLWPIDANADEWWGRDKALHFTVSIGLSSASYALAVPLTEHRDYRALTAASASLLIGAGKEGYDALGYGDPSWRDFAWDVAGTAVGVMIAYAVDCIINDPARRTANPATAASPLVIAF